jgi:SAM-dependent methyltransferase
VELQRVWNRLGRKDPLWAVLTDARYKDGRWDPDALFAIGVAQIDEILLKAQQRHLTFGRQAALDFGCGVGRLSQALARDFESVVGIDIAASMIAEAQRRNKFGSKCKFIVNNRPDLSAFLDGSFDFVVTLLVLQHIEPRYAKHYIAEFVRVLRSDGLIVFQVPAERTDASSLSQRELALPDEAYRAELSCSRSGLFVTPGSAETVTVTIHNPTPHTWPPSVDGVGLGVGNHWLGPDGIEIQQDDGRSYLGAEVASGESATLDLVISAPDQPGRYVVEFDMVHEAVTWFAQKGSPTLRLPVHVRPRPWSRVWPSGRGTKREKEQGSTRMEMHVIATEEVITLVESAGARVAWIDSQPVPGFADCTYYVTKN